jgi:hypothetical protein
MLDGKSYIENSANRLFGVKVRKSFSLTLILILWLFSFYYFSSVNANFHEPPPTMKIISPTSDKMISQTDVLLNVTVVLYRYSPSFVFETMSWMNYSLDNGPAVNLTIARGPNADGPGHYETATNTLSGLTGGSHLIRVMGESNFNATFDQALYFWVNLNQPKPTPTATPSQSVTPTTSQSPSQTATPTQAAPEFTWLTLPILLVSTLCIAVTLKLKKYRLLRFKDFRQRLLTLRRQQFPL